MAGILEACRAGRLTRSQHVLLRLGELIAHAEGAACFAARAAAALDGDLPEKADHRFDPAVLAAMSRVFARDAAHMVACEGLRWVVGAGGSAESGFGPVLDAVRTAQTGLVTDMDRVADALYGRAVPDTETKQ
jgi:alkylation response protein AidB-like acyl-CoA dehydrogenase